MVVIHEAFGLNADIRGHADRLAALGYLALAPDLYDGGSWLRCIRGMIRQLHAGSGTAFDALDACRGWLAERAGLHRQDRGDRLLHGRRLCAAVRAARAVRRRGGQLRRGPLGRGNGARGFLPDCGQLWRSRPDGQRPIPKRLEAALTALGVRHDVKVYPAAGHSFMSPKPAAMTRLTALARLNYDKEAAEDTWQRIFAFFGQHLRD